MIFDYIQTTEEQKDILDIARQICEKELLPQVPELDRTGTYPRDVAKKLFDAGLYALEVPEQYGGMGVSHAVGERGHDYYISNKVVYLCLDGQYGKAIVEGSEPYELEFEYKNGEISHLTCSCFCSYPCKHEVAAMLQLQETLELIEENYAAQYERSHSFAAVSKGAFISFVMDGRETGSFTLNGEVPHGKSL